ncbi:MAG TPA: HRDC domain-containing protein [Candidatus Tyrphobacter sp.]
MIESADALESLCARVLSAKRVAIDTEFHAERTYSPRLMVVQLAFQDGVAIVDPLAVPQLDALAEALTHTEVVGHALSSDLKILADRFDRVPTHVLDTQIAAAFLGYGVQISLADLVHDLRGVRLTKSQTVSDWGTRPLSPRQIEYLVDDVAHLLPMQDVLLERLRNAGRLEWVLEECAALGDIERYRIDERRAYLRIPGATRMNRRELAVLRGLVRLRDRFARRRDVPPRYVLPDDVVAGLATMRPKHEEDLLQLRRLDVGARRQLGAAIIETVAEAEALDEEALPERPKRPLGNARDTLVSLMSIVVGEIARAHDLAPSLLVPRAALERLSRELPDDPQAFAQTLELSPWRLELVAEPLQRLLRGDASLSVEGYAQGDPNIRLRL